MNRETYRRAFDSISFSPDFQERTLTLLQTRNAEKENDHTMKLRNLKRMAVMLAAVVCVLMVTVSAAHSEIVWELVTTFFVSGETEDGSFAAIRVPEVTLEDRDGRVILTVEGKETDVTDALDAEQLYVLVQEEEDGRIEIEVTGTPGDCVCSIRGYRQDLEGSLFTVTFGKNEPLTELDVEYSVAEESMEIDGSTLTNVKTVTVTKNDEFVVGHYDGEDIYGLVTDDPQP